MDNLRAVARMFFRHTSPVDVLNGVVGYNRMEDDNLFMLSNAYLPEYSNNEIKNMFHFLCGEFEWQNNRMRGEEQGHRSEQINVFDVLFVLGDAMLIEEDGIPKCRYENLLRWRETTLFLDEDLLVTSFLAYRDFHYVERKRSFFWKPVIGHNNWALNRMMEKGVAENHFHLKGSAPLFHLSWINMMNHVCIPEFYEALGNYDKRRLNLDRIFQVNVPMVSLKTMYMQAALIRIYLFADIMKLEIPAWLNNNDILELLSDPYKLECYLSDIQHYIDLLIETVSFSEYDYAICKPWLYKNADHGLNEVITGERWFLYEIFRRIYRRDEYLEMFGDLFYMYIIIKNNIRGELVQSNQNVGFDNFMLYQDRKEKFIEKTAMEKVYTKMAVRDTIENQHIVRLEARITPRKNDYDNKVYIDKRDSWITEDCTPEEKEALLRKYFYVFHFVKRQEKEDSLKEQEHRHYVLRKDIQEEAIGIARFRKKYPAEAARVKGIDACASEIGCRPEVFGHAFRFLREQMIHEYIEEENRYIRLSDLKITYHVGEDFLDIIDGMRAIDEAICFLNLRCGDRLGHALAVGVDVQEWYEAKSMNILISQMDYLDNLVWIYAKIRQFQLTDCEAAVKFIEKRYDEYFRTIYLNNMSAEYFESVMDNAAKYFDKKEIPNHYINRQHQFSLNTYYDSWKLRGDNPEFYRQGYFRIDDLPLSDWDRFGVNKVFPDNYQIRYNPEASFLYHLYHFNPGVKCEGNKKIEIKINPCIVKAAEAVQEKMQEMLAKKGIGIEANPSSNYMIGSFKRYDKHPITKWYNNGLTNDPLLLEQCAQIPVSINTGDQGVFSTYIENEYALMALSMEKAVDKDGKHMYNRTMIYQWLDRIREMGIEQSFSPLERMEWR